MKFDQERLALALKAKGPLERRFPNCFFKDGQPKKPLKLGILDDLMAYRDELGLVRREIKLFVVLYCVDPGYIEALKQPGTARIDLEGNEVDLVSDEHQKMATDSPRTVQFKEKLGPSKTPKKEKPKPPPKVKKKKGEPKPAAKKTKPKSQNQGTPKSKRPTVVVKKKRRTFSRNPEKV